MKNEINFYDQCYQALRKVPKGKVTTYKEIANFLGTKAYRAVGTAMNKNPDAPRTPCHRVVNTDGRLGGYAFGIKKKVELLSKEGVKVEAGKIKNLEKVIYRFRK